MKQLIINNIKTDYDIDENGIIFSHKTNKILKGSIFNTGYRMVRLTINGQKKAYAVHRLVAENFIPNDQKMPIVNHKDGNKLNNNVDNLEWVTQSQNRQHAINTKISNLATGKRNKTISINPKDWIRYKDTSYLISQDGVVYNEKTHILLKQTPNNSGYIRYTLRINNKNVSKLAHSLVMETWGKHQIQPNQVINHKDGNKLNNSIANLEICTKSKNALHACYVLQKNVKPVIRILEDNTIIEYPSITKAAKCLKVTDSAIRYALKNNTQCCQSYWKYK